MLFSYSPGSVNGSSSVSFTTSLPQHRHCDNMGVVKHGNVAYSALKDGQAQSDLIRIFQSVDRDLPFKCEYVWVESHTDSKRLQYKRTEIEKDNTRVDDLAKQALIESVMSRTFISPHFPFESVQIYAGDTKLTGRLRPFITNHTTLVASQRQFSASILTEVAN